MSTVLESTPNADRQQSHSADSVLQLLRDGNRRFVEERRLARNDLKLVEQTAGGQHPLGVLISCIDSRVPVETVFDLGIGDVFSARIAGNVINDDLIGSTEFACKLAGARLVVVMGHTGCGAVKGAAAGAKLGHLTGLLEKIRPAVEDVAGELPVAEPTAETIDAIATRNVERSIEELRTRSETLAELEAEGAIRLVGAIYDVASGEVRFL